MKLSSVIKRLEQYVSDMGDQDVSVAETRATWGNGASQQWTIIVEDEKRGKNQGSTDGRGDM